MPQPQMFNLSGRRAIVTGAGRGLGREIAEALATAGADVAVTSRSLQSLDDTVAAIRAAGSKAVPLQLDVRNVAAAAEAVAAAAHELGGLDVLVNNAGVEQVCPSLEVDEQLWDQILDTNLKGAFFCAQAAAQRMISDGRPGSIINICSLTSHVGVPTAVPYGSSKSGLLGMTRALAAEWATLGIRVNAIAPGYFRTAMTDDFYEDDDWRKAMLGKIPMRRFGRPGDLGGAAIFLASDASGYMTGQCLALDGGFLASI